MKDNKKIVGWLILVLGLITIFWSLYASYVIFTGRANPPELFQADEVDPLTEKSEDPVIREESEWGMEGPVGEQIPREELEQKIGGSMEEQFFGDESEREMEKLVGDQISGLIPAGAITDILNLMAWSIMAGIMIFGGSRLSEVGIKLLKA